MKLPIYRLATALCLGALALAATATLVQADEKKIVPGPKGGKLLENASPRAEFLLLPDRKVAITFYGEDLKPVPATAQAVVVYADVKPTRVKLEFENKDGVLTSKTPMPPDDGYGVVVQIKPTADAKAQTFKIKFHEELCPTCKRAEYACTCPEDKHDEHDHAKKK